ncbi:MAG TPA: serine hydrolase domain-containing protein [Bryobacteraceae bacterium]|jgi:CubicO group peptidase (beta-lactamase class C family)|nr:serine hydrolase domain-containing protein [Bryobacteraceae bacterium]
MTSATQSSASTLNANLDRVIDRAVTERRIAGAVVLVSHDGKPVHQQAAGFADREAGMPMRENAIFRLSSLTKPIVSATALALVEREQLNLGDTVAKWIPEFQPALPDGTRPEITIRELLNHTAGLGYGFFEPEDGPYHQANVSDGLDQPGLSMRENLKRIASVPLAYKPGTSWGYSVAADVAGEVIVRASRSSLPEAVSRFVTTPLAMRDTGFAVADTSRLAVPYADGSPLPVRMGAVQVVKLPFGPGSIRFAPSRAFDPNSYPSGGCGMVGTAADFVRFLEALRSGGSPILSAQSVRAMTTDQTGGRGPGPGTAFGFGLSVVTEPEIAQTPQSAGTFAWGGVYGHSWFVDPAKRLTVVVLTNTAVEGLTGQFPMQIRDAIYAAL